MLAVMAYAHFFAKRYDEAATCAEQALHEKHQYHVALRIAAASHALAGRLVPAQAAVKALQTIDPNLRIASLRDQTPLVSKPDRTRYEQGLRKAGLPE